MDRWTCQKYMDRKKDRENYTPRRKIRGIEEQMEWKREIHKQTDRLTVCHAVTQTSVTECESRVASALTFLLPSVTVRGTGMGGHLLRLGGGFSLFHRMMIWSSRGGTFYIPRAQSCWLQKYASSLRCHGKLSAKAVMSDWFIYLRAVFWLWDHLKQLHDWLWLGDQWGDGMDDSSELLIWTDPWTRPRKSIWGLTRLNIY